MSKIYPGVPGAEYYVNISYQLKEAVVVLGRIELATAQFKLPVYKEGIDSGRNFEVNKEPYNSSCRRCKLPCGFRSGSRKHYSIIVIEWKS